MIPNKFFLTIIACAFMLNAFTQHDTAVFVTGKNTVYYKLIMGFVSETNPDSAVGYWVPTPYNPYKYQRTIHYLKTNKIMAQYEAYEKIISNKLKTTKTVIEIRDGKYQQWYADGTLQLECFFKENVRDSVFKQYHPNGELKRIEHWKDQKWQSGKCFDANGNEVEFTLFLKPAKFQGGIEGLYKYLSENLVYPPDAQKKGIQGRVIVRFVIGKDGGIRDVEIVTGVYKSLDNEALRIVRKMPRWEPAYFEGKLVGVKHTLPINFRLE